MKEILLKLYYWGNLSKEKTNEFQTLIRDVEWEAIKPHIKKGNFLDVGCGAGYSMLKANELGCTSYGVDPNPGGHGVGRVGSGQELRVNIKQGFAENLDFESNFFDTVYSSHVLEHVNSEVDSLREMKRVLKDDGILIIGVPTDYMARLNWLSQIIFTTHHKLINLTFSKFINTGKTKFRELFIPNSHGQDGKTILFDINHYKISNWYSIISKELSITVVLKPAYYPFPEYKQLFKMKKNYRKSSSVFFICKK